MNLLTIFVQFILIYSNLVSRPCINAQESRYAQQYKNLYYGPYKHIYPPADITKEPASCTPSENVTCPLYLAYMTTFVGDFVASGAIPGVQLALDQINDDPTILPGYRLHYVLKDTEVYI